MWRPITRSEASLLFFPSNRANILSRRRLVKEPVHHPFETLFEKSPFSLEPRFIAGRKLRAPPSFVSFLPSPRIGGMARTRRNRTTIRVPIALEKRSSSRERISSTKLKIVKIVSVFFKLRPRRNEPHESRVFTMFRLLLVPYLLHTIDEIPFISDIIFEKVNRITKRIDRGPLFLRFYSFESSLRVKYFDQKLRRRDRPGHLKSQTCHSGLRPIFDSLNRINLFFLFRPLSTRSENDRSESLSPFERRHDSKRVERRLFGGGK